MLRFTSILFVLSSVFASCAPVVNDQAGPTSWVRSALYPSASSARKACDKAAEDAKRKTRDENYGIVEVKLDKGNFSFSSSLGTTYRYCLRYFELGGDKVEAVIGKPILFLRGGVPEKTSIALIGSDFLKIDELATVEVASTAEQKSYSPTNPTAQQVAAMDKADSIEIRLRFAGVDQWKLLTRDMFKGGL